MVSSSALAACGAASSATDSVDASSVAASDSSLAANSEAVASGFDAEANAARWLEFDANDARHYFSGADFGKTEDFDFDKFIHSELSEKILDRMERFVAYPDEMDPAVVSYWAEQGLTKELHDADNEDCKWASYTPVSAKENPDAKYPVLFVLHGIGNPIYLTEAYGFMDLAAEKQLIAVAPWASDDDTIVEELPRIMEELKANYPVDESRIYVAGFSKGGISTAVVTSYYPELFAAAAPCGMQPGMWANSRTPNDDKIKALYIPEDSELWNKNVQVPLINMYGTCDQGPVAETEELYVLNHFLNVAGCTEVTPDAIKAAWESDDPVEQVAGIPFDKTEINVLDGTNYYTGDRINKNGTTMFRMVRIEGLGHWPSGSMAEVAWDYMSQFSRNPETGELVVDSN